MKNLKRVKQLIQCVNKLFLESQMTEIKNEQSSESLLFIAQKEIFITDISLYNFAISKVAILPDVNNKEIIAFHTYFNTEQSFVDKLVADIGEFKISSVWGINDENEPQIYTWGYKQYQVTLNKQFRKLKNLYLSYPVDVLTISTLQYEVVKKNAYTLLDSE